MSTQPSPGGQEVRMIDLRVGDHIMFDGSVYTVAEPPQSIWGVVELWVEELDWPLTGSESSTFRSAPLRP